MSNFYSYDAGLPCRNPHCKSKGKPHPNCRCWSHGGDDRYAKGGEVHFCSSSNPHKMGCEYYADGGSVSGEQAAPQIAHPDTIIGHSAISHGLLGLLKNVGKSRLDKPEKHHKSLEKTKMHLGQNDHERAASSLHENPLSGSVGKETLKKIIPIIGPQMMNAQSDPDALRSSIDFLHSSLKGHDSLDGHIGKTLGSDKTSIDHDEDGIENLQKYLQEIKEKPEELLNVGGNLGHYLPDQAAGLGAMAATATEYLNAIKPMPSQGASLDEVMAPDKNSMDQWNRHLGIAQKPQVILQYVKEGTLLPQDLLTLQTIYPGLYKSMVQKAGESLIEAKTKHKDIPYHQKQSLSLLLGEPLDSTMTPESMQAIIRSAGPQQAQVQQNKKKGPQKASAVELKQINKVDEMYQTPSESRQINRGH